MPGFGPTWFFLITLPHDSHASVENGVSPQDNRNVCTSTSTWSPSTWGAFLDRPLFMNCSESMAFKCRADIILCGHQAVAGLTPSWEEICFGLQQCQTNAQMSTMFIVYGIRQRAHPSVMGLAPTPVMRSSVATRPLVHPLDALLPWQHRIAQRDLCCLFWF